MTDVQILTMAMAVIVPLSMLIYSNSRISEAKETLRVEIQALRAEIHGVLSRIENKLDHVVETQATHSERIDKLAGGRA